MTQTDLPPTTSQAQLTPRILTAADGSNLEASDDSLMPRCVLAVGGVTAAAPGAAVVEMALVLAEYVAKAALAAALDVGVAGLHCGCVWRGGNDWSGTASAGLLDAAVEAGGGVLAAMLELDHGAQMQ